MTSEIAALVSRDLFGIDRPATKEEARAFLGLLPSSPAYSIYGAGQGPNHSHNFVQPNMTHHHSIAGPGDGSAGRVVVGWDGSSHGVDSMVYATLAHKSNSLKHLASGLDFPIQLNSWDHETSGLPHLDTFTKYDPTIKETTSMTTRLRIPTDTVERRDISTALQAMGNGDLDSILNMIAFVQDLEEGERIVRAEKLKKDEIVGTHITIIDSDEAGRSGWCTDYALSERGGEKQLVLDGEIVKVPYWAYVIISEPAAEVDEVNPNFPLN